jgi:hypothetical protein
MMRIMIGAAVASLVVSSVCAQQQPPQTVRIGGAIETVDGNMLTIKTREVVGAGADTLAVITREREFKVNVPDNVAISAVVRKSLADVKPGTFVEVNAISEADGSQCAVRINIFSEAQRGHDEGHRPWRGVPNSTITTGTVDTSVARILGQVLTVSYKDGKQRIVVASETAIVSFVSSDKSELEPGAQIIIAVAQRQPHNVLQAQAVNVGRGNQATDVMRYDEVGAPRIKITARTCV